MMKRLLSLFMLTVLLVACHSHSKENQETYIPEAPNYQDSTLWYSHDKGEEVDVFYITPTCIFDWTDKDSGLLSHYYDVNGEVMKENFDYSLNLADEIFAQECNFYAPYYRQISLDSWLLDEDEIESRFALAMKDVREAFSFYLKTQNDGKPFILAGYSQGAKAVIELVKSMKAEDVARMKAAYAIGYQLTEEDLKHPQVKPAQKADDQGVIISYNSVQTVNDIWKAVGGKSKACINPVNWCIDSTLAKLNDSIKVQIEPTRQVLVVSGYDGGGLNIPMLDGTVTLGNYHLSELTLYKECLQKNVRQRIQ